MSGKLSVWEDKGAKDRTLWAGEEVLDQPQEWMDRRSEDAQRSRFLLPTRKGTEVAASHLRRSVKRCARKADIKEVNRISPHTLRHTFATRLYRDTDNIRLMQKALGHLDLSTTMIYTYVAGEELEGAMKGLWDRIGSAKEQARKKTCKGYWNVEKPSLAEDNRRCRRDRVK